jgi:hypothetical protein
MPGKSASKNTGKSGGKSAKAVRAEKRGAEAIQEGLRKMELNAPDAPEFFSVQKVLGNGSFLIRNAWGVEYRGAGGHGGGKARIAVGHIVLADHSATPQQGLEILALIDDRKQAAELVKRGFMAPTIVSAALGAGSVSTGGAPVEEEGYVFAEAEAEEGDEEAEVDVNAL